MKRRSWFLLLTALLGVGLLPACSWLGRRGTLDCAPAGSVIGVNMEPPTQRVAANDAAALQARAVVELRNEPPLLTGEPSALESGPSSLAQSPVAPIPPTPPSEPIEPAIAAFQFLLKNQPDDALQQLKLYDARTQEFLICMLPPMVSATRKGLDRMTPTEVGALQDMLLGVHHRLRWQADLVIEKACFCESIRDYGEYRPLHRQHRFRAARPGQPGELVQLYVELRNFHCEPRDGAFQTRLSSKVELRNEKGELVWMHDFQDRDEPYTSLAPRNDYFNNYAFEVPASVPPGSYQLTIQVIDQTRTPFRTAKQSIEFLVSAAP